MITKGVPPPHVPGESQNLSHPTSSERGVYNKFGSPRGANVQTYDSTDAYQDDDGVVLSSSPLPPLDIGAVQRLFEEYLPQERWPLDEEDEANLPGVSALHPSPMESIGTPGRHSPLDEVPVPYRVQPRRLQYTQTIYGPRQSNMLGMRVSGKRRAETSTSSSTELFGASESTAVPESSMRGSLARTLFQNSLHYSQADQGSMDAESVKTVVNPRASDIHSVYSKSGAAGLMHPSPDRAAGANVLSSLADSGGQRRSTSPLVPLNSSRAGMEPISFHIEAIGFSQQPEGLGESLVSDEPSSLESDSGETLASDTLCPYIPGSFIINPVPESSSLAQSSKRPNRSRKGSTARLGERLPGQPSRSPAPEDPGRLLFQRNAIRSAPPNASLLTSKFGSNDTSQSQAQIHLARYGRAGAGESDANGITISLYFPNQTSVEATSPLPVRIRKDVTMEELIGYGLFCYVEKHGEPPQHPDADEEELDIYLETTAWSLHMVEDGEVDEDYPAIDRSLVVGRFGETEFAICPTSQPRRTYSMLTTDAWRRPEEPTSTVDVPNTLAMQPLRDRPNESEPNTLSLQIMVVPTAMGMTTIRVPPRATAAQVLAIACRHCLLSDPSGYALLYRDVDEVIPLDRSVRDFYGRTDLVLVERTTLPRAAEAPVPSARPASSMPEQPKYKTAMDLISNYKVRRLTDAGLFCQPAPPHLGWPPRACTDD